MGLEHSNTGESSLWCHVNIISDADIVQVKIQLTLQFPVGSILFKVNWSFGIMCGVFCNVLARSCLSEPIFD